MRNMDRNSYVMLDLDGIRINNSRRLSSGVPDGPVRFLTAESRTRRAGARVASVSVSRFPRSEARPSPRFGGSQRTSGNEARVLVRPGLAGGGWSETYPGVGPHREVRPALRRALLPPRAVPASDATELLPSPEQPERSSGCAGSSQRCSDGQVHPRTTMPATGRRNFGPISDLNLTETVGRSSAHASRYPDIRSPIAGQIL